MHSLKNYIQFILSIIFELFLEILGINKDVYYKKYADKPTK
jgi:hypothetical protein